MRSRTETCSVGPKPEPKSWDARSANTRPHWSDQGTTPALALGTLTDRMIVAEGDEIVPDKLIQPRAIAQQAFVLGDGLAGPGVTTGAAFAAIAGVMPAIEIVDSRIIDWNTQLLDMIADNAASGRVVLGGRLTSLPGPRPATDGDAAVSKR